MAYSPTFGLNEPIGYAGNKSLEEYAMSAKEEQLIQLLGLMARSMTHMTASVTAMAFEQLRSQDAALQSSAKRMIERMQAINEELDQQWELVGQLTGNVIKRRLWKCWRSLRFECIGRRRHPEPMTILKWISPPRKVTPCPISF